MDTLPSDRRALPDSPLAFAVPIVDITPYVSGGEDAARERVATEMDTACREVGFVQIRGHGVPEATLAGLAAAIDAYFAQPLEHKLRDRAPPEINRGYAPPYSESLSLSLGLQPTAPLKDYFEAFNVGTSAAAFPELSLLADIYAPNRWPSGAADFDAAQFQRAVWAYFEQAGRVARTRFGQAGADALQGGVGLVECAAGIGAIHQGLAVEADLGAQLGAHLAARPMQTPVPVTQALGLSQTDGQARRR